MSGVGSTWPGGRLPGQGGVYPGKMSAHLDLCFRRVVCLAVEMYVSGCLPGYEGVCPVGYTSPREQNSLPMLVKTFPFCNFVCGR